MVLFGHMGCQNLDLIGLMCISKTLKQEKTTARYLEKQNFAASHGHMITKGFFMVVTQIINLPQLAQMEASHLDEIPLNTKDKSSYTIELALPNQKMLL